MRYIRALDDFLIDRVFQPLVNRLSGVSRLELARFLMSGVLVAILGRAYLLFQAGEMTLPRAALDGVLLAVSLTLYWSGGMLRSVQGSQNPQRIHPVLMLTRVVAALALLVRTIDTMASPSGPGLLSCGLLLLVVAQNYVLACNDGHPPSLQRRSAPEGTKLAFTVGRGV